MMPSDSAKPSAKASKFCGVHIITAWDMPLNTRATGTSEATASMRCVLSAGVSTVAGRVWTAVGSVVSIGAILNQNSIPRAPLECVMLLLR